MADDMVLAELERDVEQARARLVADIALLRAPETLESARQSVMESIIGYRDDAIEAAQFRATSFIDSVKAKAAANPVAAAAVLAGIAWRLYRRPPVASLLVGAGIAALARTDPNDDSLRPARLAQRAAHRALELRDRAASQIAQLTEGAVGGALERLQGGRQERRQERLQESLQDKLQERSLAVGRRGRASLQGSPESYAPAPSLFDDRESRQRRDAYLLGFAALALGAAIGVARRRKAPDERRKVEELSEA